MPYEVVHCSECGRAIKSAPIWLSTVKVDFSCETCRQKHPKPAGYDPIPAKAARFADADEDPASLEVVDEEEDVVEEELEDVEASFDPAVEE